MINRFTASAALILTLLAGSQFASAATINLALTAGSTDGSDNAGYWGGGPVSLTNINLSLSWTTDAAAYNCSNGATLSSCVLKNGNPTAMSAFFSGTSNSNTQSFTTNSDASVTQNTNSAGNNIYIQKSGTGSYVDWYVVGSGILQAGHFYSSTAFNSNSVLDASYMATVIANITLNSWFISTAWNGSDLTYYSNGGDYFDGFGGLAASSASPEPGTWLSLLGGLAITAGLKLRRRS